MFPFTQLLVIAAAVSTAYGATDKVTSSPRDYYLLSKRELLYNITQVNAQIAGIDARILNRVDAITYEQKQLLVEIQMINRSNFPLLARKDCIQKYAANFITYDSAADQLAVCHKIVSEKATTYTSAEKSKTAFANYAATTILSQYIAECDSHTSNDKDYLQNLENCYTDKVTAISKVVNKELGEVKDLLETTLFASAEDSESAMNCSFNVKMNVLEAIRQTNKAIQTCEECFESGSFTEKC